ncbi:hypothetical protein RI367_003202 [Sorochytrium milnesiophthora]
MPRTLSNAGESDTDGGAPTPKRSRVDPPRRAAAAASAATAAIFAAATNSNNIDATASSNSDTAANQDPSAPDSSRPQRVKTDRQTGTTASPRRSRVRAPDAVAQQSSQDQTTALSASPSQNDDDLAQPNGNDEVDDTASNTHDGADSERASTPVIDSADDPSASTTATSTPLKRKRGRPPASASSDAKRGLGSKSSSGGEKKRWNFMAGGTGSKRNIMATEVDASGEIVDLEESDDSVDPKGELKITKDGALLGGRSFRFQPFQLVRRHPTRFYVFAADVAKCVGERDAYTLFQRHCEELKLHTAEEDREHLISIGRLAPHLKSRNLTIMTARNAFRRFGHIVVLNGKRIVDDYWVGDQVYVSENEGDPRTRSNTDQMIVSTLARPYQRAEPKNGQTNNVPESPSIAAYAEKMNLPLPDSADEALYLCALSARQFNARLTSQRQAVGPRFSEVHTGVEFVRQDMKSSRIGVQMDITAATRERILSGKLTGPVVDDTIALQWPAGVALDDPAEDPSAWLSVSPVSTDKNVRQYPLALLSGQWQAAQSIFRERFRPQPKTEPPVFPASYQQYIWQTKTPQPARTDSASAVQHAAAADNSVPSATALTAALLDTPGGGVIKYNSCAGRREDGGPCGRRVPEAGDFCRYHTHQLREKKEKEKKQAKRQSSIGSTTGNDARPGTPTPGRHKSAEPPIPPGYCGDCRNPPDQPPEGKSESRPATIACTKCTRSYHPSCVDISSCVALEKIQSYDWECPDCKLCIACNETGDEGKMLFCDDCDRGWHSYCLSPPLETIPEGKWHCPLCAYCVACHRRDLPASQLRPAIVDTRTGDEATKPNDLVHNQYLGKYCTQCWPRFYTNTCCPMCLKTYSEDAGNVDEDGEQTDGDMVSCDTCERWCVAALVLLDEEARFRLLTSGFHNRVHVKCDSGLTRQRYRQLVQDTTQRYHCPVCENRVLDVDGPGGDVRMWRGKPVYINELVKRGEYQFRRGTGIVHVDKRGKVDEVVQPMEPRPATASDSDGGVKAARNGGKGDGADEEDEEEEAGEEEQIEEDSLGSSPSEPDDDDEEDEDYR